MSEEPSTGMNPAIKLILIVAGVLCLLACGVAGVMAWFVGTSVQRYEKKAAVQSTKSQMRNIEAAVNAYRLENRALPASLDDLVGPQGVLDADEAPTDAWGRPFLYEPGDDGRSYVLVSFGADGVEGGEGDAADITREDLGDR